MTTYQEENEVTTMQEVAVTDRHIAIVHQVQYNLHFKLHLIMKTQVNDLQSTVIHISGRNCHR